MPNNSYYIDLFNNDLPPNPVISTVYTANGPPGAAIPSIFHTQQYFHACLHNPINSNKIIKIKNLDYKYTMGGASLDTLVATLSVASAVSYGEIEAYEKLDTNAPNLPANIGLTNTITGQTTTGTLRRSNTQIRPNKTFGINFNACNNAVLPWFSGQKNFTTCQDITLNANRHIVMTLAGATGAPPNVKYQINALFSSGSNSYYQTITAGATNFFKYLNNDSYYHPFAFINGSSTTIKIHRLDVAMLYSDSGQYSFGFSSQGSYGGRHYFFTHLKNDQIAPSLPTDLINSDVYNITSLDSTNTLPSNIKCYKNSVAMLAPFSEAQFGAGVTSDSVSGGSNFSQNQIPLPISVRARYFQSTQQLSQLYANNNPFMRLNHYSGATNSKLDYHKSGQEIILNPGEGLGFVTIESSGTSDFADGSPFGHITFTVEDIPATETGFGY